MNGEVCEKLYASISIQNMIMWMWTFRLEEKKEGVSTFISSTKEGKPPMDINVKNPATYDMQPALPCSNKFTTPGNS